MKNTINRSVVAATLLGISLLALSGCGTTTSSELAGLSVGVNLAQKGVVGGVTFVAGTNAATIGVTYGSGTNEAGGTVTVPGL
jgi:hypothetical protein